MSAPSFAAHSLHSLVVGGGWFPVDTPAAAVAQNDLNAGAAANDNGNDNDRWRAVSLAALPSAPAPVSAATSAAIAAATAKSEVELKPVELRLPSTLGTIARVVAREMRRLFCCFCRP